VSIARTLWPLLVVAPLAALFISRAGLVLHEMGGHAALALAFGGKVTDYHLFWFGGGRVHYELAAPSASSTFVIHMGGIASEVLVGAAACCALRFAKHGLARFLLFTLGASFVLHGLFYLVEGTHYGYGDTRGLHLVLGSQRPWLVVPGTFALGALALVAGGGFARFVEGWLGPHARRERAAVFAAVVAVAGGVHYGLTRAEAALTSDETYARIFRAEAHDRAQAEAKRELGQRDQERRARGEPALSEGDRARLLEELAARHRPFPLRPLLWGVIVACLVAGLLARHRPRAAVDGPPTWASARWMALGTALAMGFVALLRDPW
jgi:hypothetical protein